MQVRQWTRGVMAIACVLAACGGTQNAPPVAPDPEPSPLKPATRPRPATKQTAAASSASTAPAGAIPPNLVGKRSCDGLGLTDCIRLARLYEEGNGVPADPMLAAQIYYKAGSWAGEHEPVDCRSRVCNPEQQGLAQKHAAMTAKLFVKACDLKHPHACVVTGSAHRVGNGVPLDKDKAREFYQAGCELGDAAGCARVGQLYAEANDEPNAMTWLRRGCDGGELEACDLVGTVCVDRAIAEKDATARAALVTCATTALLKACDGNFGKGASCELLGTAFVRGAFGPVDKTNSASLFTKACAAGSADFCVPDQPVQQTRRKTLDGSCTGEVMDRVGRWKKPTLPPSAYVFVGAQATRAARIAGCEKPALASSSGGAVFRGEESLWCCP